MKYEYVPFALSAQPHLIKERIWNSLGNEFNNRKWHIKYPDQTVYEVKRFLSLNNITPKQFPITAINAVILHAKKCKYIEQLYCYISLDQYNIIKNLIDITDYKTNEEKKIEELTKRIDVFRDHCIIKNKRCREIESENEELKQICKKQKEENTELKDKLMKICEISTVK
jgi:hypothetical protein